MKDFFDVSILARTFAFDGVTLAAAIAATFARRGTILPAQPSIALTDVFATDVSKRQWQAFLRRGGVTGATTLVETITTFGVFLRPPTRALAAGSPFTQHGPPGGRWQE